MDEIRVRFVTAAGGDPSASLGHSSPAVTHNHYLDPRLDGSLKQAELLPCPLKLAE